MYMYTCTCICNYLVDCVCYVLTYCNSLYTCTPHDYLEHCTMYINDNLTPNHSQWEMTFPDLQNANPSVCTHGGVGPTESLGSEHKMPTPNNLSCLVAQLIEYLSRILTFEAHWRQLVLKWLSWVVLGVWVGPCCLTKQQPPYYTKN